VFQLSHSHRIQRPVLCRKLVMQTMNVRLSRSRCCICSCIPRLRNTHWCVTLMPFIYSFVMDCFACTATTLTNVSRTSWVATHRDIDVLRIAITLPASPCVLRPSRAPRSQRRIALPVYIHFYVLRTRGSSSGR
jgi:hypothetical protein